MSVAPGVLALLTDPKGHVLISVTDFELSASGGSLLEGQTWRVKHRLAVNLVKRFCPSWLAAALDNYHCDEIVNHLLSNQGFVRTVIPIGHNDDIGQTKRIRLGTPPETGQ